MHTVFGPDSLRAEGEEGAVGGVLPWEAERFSGRGIRGSVLGPGKSRRARIMTASGLTGRRGKPKMFPVNATVTEPGPCCRPLCDRGSA